MAAAAQRINGNSNLFSKGNLNSSQISVVLPPEEKTGCRTKGSRIFEVLFGSDKV